MPPLFPCQTQIVHISSVFGKMHASNLWRAGLFDLDMKKHKIYVISPKKIYIIHPNIFYKSQSCVQIKVPAFLSFQHLILFSKRDLPTSLKLPLFKAYLIGLSICYDF